MRIDRDSAPHYVWGGRCDGWRLLAEADMAVIQERMPPGTEEERHTHLRTRQFFYVLDGTLTLEVGGECVALSAGQGASIAPGVAHQAVCAANAGRDAEFLVISAPGDSRADREPADKELRR